MADATFKVAGLAELKKKLSTFEYKLQLAAGRTACRRAMVPVRDAARAAARTFDRSQSKEQVFANVYMQQSRRMSREIGGVAMRVGILGGARQRVNNRSNRQKHRVGETYQTGGSSDNPGGDTWYWRMREFGTEHEPARPFLRPALEKNAQAVATILATELGREIDKLAVQR